MSIHYLYHAVEASWKKFLRFGFIIFLATVTSFTTACSSYGSWDKIREQMDDGLLMYLPFLLMGPRITSATLANDNSCVTVGISQNVYTDKNRSGDLTTGDFVLHFNQNGGTATNVTISTVTHTAGTDTAVICLTITGTPSGVETIEIQPANGSSIYNGRNMPMHARQTTHLIYLHNTTPPQVTNVSVTSLNDADVGSVSVTITFNKTMDPSVNPSPQITGLTTDPYTISGSTWTAGNTRWTGTFTFTDNNEERIGNYNITGFTDSYGIVMLPDLSQTVVVDTLNPTLTTESIASSNANPSYARVGDVVTVSFTSSEPIQIPTVTIGLGTGTVSGGSTSWSAAYTMTGGDTEGSVTFSISNILDILGNTGTDVSGVTDGSSVCFDQGFLSGLTLSPAGIWDASFSTGTLTYNITQPWNVSSVDVAATVSGVASVSINAVPGATATIVLGAQGSTTAIQVDVTTQCGVTTTYTVNVTRGLCSSNDTLSNLTANGTWNMPFATGSFAYNVLLAGGQTTLNVAATIPAGASVTMNGVSGATQAINVSGAPKIITVVVSSECGVAGTPYVLNVLPCSTESHLSNLTTNVGSWTPAVFNPTTLAYTIDVASSVASVDVTATRVDATSSVSINGAGASDTGTVALNGTGTPTVFTVIVTDQCGTTPTTYTLTVNRGCSTESHLSNLTTNVGSWTPAVFNPTTLAYTIDVASSVASVDVTATRVDGTSSVSINGAGASDT